MSFLPFEIGEEVHDDLTGEICNVVGLGFEIGRIPRDNGRFTNSIGCWGIYLDSKYLDGGRFPWEVSRINNHPEFNFNYKEENYENKEMADSDRF